jgi:hypothetical protein
MGLTINADIPAGIAKQMRDRIPAMRRDVWAYVASKVLPEELIQCPFDTGLLENSITFIPSADGMSATNGTNGVEYALEQHENENIDHSAAWRHKATAKSHFISDPTRDIGVPALTEYLRNQALGGLMKP